MDHVKRDYTGQKINRPSSYCKIEIESYDPSHIYYQYNSGFKGTNVTKYYKEGFSYFKLDNSKTNSTYTINSNYKILSTGKYRVEVFCFTTTNKQSLTLYLNNKKINTKSGTAKDVFMRRVDFGLHDIKQGTLPVKVVAGKNVGIITVYLRKIRATNGDSNNKGVLTLFKANCKPGAEKQAGSLEFTLKHEDKPYSAGGFLEENNSTGLIFQYRDVVNFYVNDIDGKERQIFGGYLSTVSLADDKMEIDVKCADRLTDAEKRRILKEVRIGGAESTLTTLVYNAKTLYDAFRYFCDAIETPLMYGNLSAVEKEIPYKLGYTVDYAKATPKKKLTVKNIKKTVNSTSVTLRNGYKKGKSQYSVLWDSSWNKKGEASGYKFTSTPIFYIQYGMGAKATNKTIKKWIPKQYTPKTHKVKKGTGVWKKVKGSIGYDISKPFLGYIEIQYSTTPKGTRKTKTINFSGNPDNQNNNIGTIKPFWKNNTLKTGELNIGAVLQQNDPASNYYIRRIALKYTVPSGSDLYDPKSKTNADLSSYKMVLRKVGFRSGNDVTSEVLQSSGQKISDLMYSAQEKLDLNMYIQYAKDRCNDKLMFFKEDKEVNIIEFSEGLDGNINSVTNISYTPISDLINSMIKVYKTSEKSNSYVAGKKAGSIFRFCEHQDMEVLNDEVGAFYANYLMKTDEDWNPVLSHTYTLDIDGYPHVHVGQLVISTLNNKVYNDMQPVKSIEVVYDPDDRASIQTTVGLGEMNPLLRAKVNMSKIRSNVKTKRVAYSGGASEEEFIDLF